MKNSVQEIIESLEQLKVALPQDYSCGIEWSIAHIKEKFESNYTRVEVPKGETAMQELTADYLMMNVKPIELPSDEEIEEYASKYSADGAIILGAKWMKEQILNQNK